MTTIDQDGSSTARPRLVRALYLIFFLFAFGVGETVLGIVTVVQFIWLLASGEPNHNLRRFGISLALWFSAVVGFLTCASDDKPFPWKDWPTAS